MINLIAIDIESVFIDIKTYKYYINKLLYMYEPTLLFNTLFLKWWADKSGCRVVVPTVYMFIGAKLHSKYIKAVLSIFESDLVIEFFGDNLLLYDTWSECIAELNCKQVYKLYTNNTKLVDEGTNIELAPWLKNKQATRAEVLVNTYLNNLHKG